MLIAVAGDSAAGKSTFCNILKNHIGDCYIFECDGYHKWDRGDKNWEKFTHLNPQANDLDILENDLILLCDGSKIDHRYYCHKTGRITYDGYINPQDNIIVCGLHSFYPKIEYDLKIYMDTNEDLRKRWKVDRDVNERGYSVSQVLDGIKKRVADHDRYILPQRDSADLTISFSSANLKLSLNNSFDLDQILSHFHSNKINYAIEYGKLNSITFSEHNYDYILYIIESKLNVR